MKYLVIALLFVSSSVLADSVKVSCGIVNPKSTTSYNQISEDQIKTLAAKNEDAGYPNLISVTSTKFSEVPYVLQFCVTSKL